MNLEHELRTYLDAQTITRSNIGAIRRQCFVPWESEWNALVRDETARRERNMSDMKPCPVLPGCYINPSGRHFYLEPVD